MPIGALLGDVCSPRDAILPLILQMQCSGNKDFHFSGAANRQKGAHFDEKFREVLVSKQESPFVYQTMNPPL